MSNDNIIWEQLLLNKIASITEQDKDGYYTAYKMNCRDGYGIRRAYRIFPGLDLVYDEFDARDFSNVSQAQFHEKISKNIIDIGYCREGRLECEFSNGLYVYMGKGDFFAGLVNDYYGVNAFPLENYQGISVYIYPDTLYRRAPQFLKDSPFNLNIDQIQNRLLPGTVCFRRADDRLEHVFLDFYCIPVSIKKTYLELKAAELLLNLGLIDYAEENRPQVYYPKQQVELIKRIRKQITGDIRRRHTIEELAAEYGVSRTSLKSCFKGVYGISIAAYMKEYRMKCAAAMLRQANSSISDISFEVGYKNQSKFAAAFKEIIGVSPLNYRKQLSD